MGSIVIPAQAGIQDCPYDGHGSGNMEIAWIPACAGMTFWFHHWTIPFSRKAASCAGVTPISLRTCSVS
jgi:hypothetical protein